MIGAMVDSAKTKVGFTMKHFINCQLYTIYRCSCTGIRFNVSKKMDLMKTQRLTYSYCMAHSRLGSVRRNDNNLSEVLYCFYKVHYTRSCHSIIICYQDNGSFCL